MTFVREGENRDVLYFDEGRFGLHSETGKRWGKVGEVLSSPVAPRYQNFYAYSAVSPWTGQSFSLFLPNVNTSMMNVYLAELSRAYKDQEILLIWDGAGWHRSRELEIPANLRIHFLPPYSPELNPVEKLWWWIRRHVCRNKLFRTLEELMAALEAAFRNMTPEWLVQVCRCSYISFIN